MELAKYAKLVAVVVSAYGHFVWLKIWARAHDAMNDAGVHHHSDGSLNSLLPTVNLGFPLI